MKPRDIHPGTLTLYGIFLALSALTLLGWMLASPSEPGNTILFGLSLPRLALALGLFLVFILFSLLTVRAARDRSWAERQLDVCFGKSRLSRILVGLGWASLGLGWTGLFLPSERTGRFEGYWLRIQPVLLFLLLAGVATLLVFYIHRRKFPFVTPSNAGILRLGVMLFLACLPVLGFMLLSRFGISSRDDFWYGAGVPVLAGQLFTAVAGGLLFLQIERKWNFRRLDLAAFLLLFAVTAFFWARQPLEKGFSFIANPPNNVLYPIFDPATFDMASQFPLIGQRIMIFGGYFFERPLYIVFLTYLHALFGQDYVLLMAAQAAVFAILPALVYLIGRSLNFRAVGFAAGLVAMLRGVNSIAASNMIDLANPKMILTDFPAAIGVVLVVLAFCEWLKQPDRKLSYALWVGGALGFTLMLRTNALLLVALIPLYALFKFKRGWKIWLLHSFLLVLGIVAITLPWELRNRSLGGVMYESIVVKFRAVFEQRYTAPSSAAPPLSITQNLLALSMLYQENVPVQQQPVCSSAACFVPNHFLHNILTSVLILPTSPVMDGLRQVVRDRDPYWYPRWDGVFVPSSLFLFVLNLFLILLGISAAWKKGGLPALAPLAVFVFYDLSNSFARTSGGRYVVPMDWIVVFYFLLGVFHLVVWIVKTSGSSWDLEPASPAPDISPPDATSSPLTKLAPALVLLLGFGSLLPLSEHLYPGRYQDINIEQTLIENGDVLATTGVDLSEIEVFRQNPNATVLVGRALFPRHYKIGEGHTYYYPNVALSFPRLTFNLIGMEGQSGVILPGGIPAYFPHAGDVLVIGCMEKDYIDALTVIVLDGEGAIYTRLPESELTCPMRQPVCDNNSVCQ